jgi:large subunit ribosomal protein L17
MRHGKKFNHLSRTKPHRKAMLSNMACSLIQHKRINTTLAKAKALRGFVEPLITKSKEDSTHSRRVVFSYLNDKLAVSELFREVAPKVANRPGGYTRIIKTGNRLGDNAEMCMMELVDFNELYVSEKEGGAKKTRRRRRGGSKSSSASTDSAAKAETSTKEEAPKAEAKAEAPKAEKKEAPKAEASTEASAKAEAKAEKPAEEAKKEEPKAEAKEEAPKAEKKEDDKKED